MVVNIPSTASTVSHLQAWQQQTCPCAPSSRVHGSLKRRAQLAYGVEPVCFSRARANAGTAPLKKKLLAARSVIRREKDMVILRDVILKVKNLQYSYGSGCCLAFARAWWVTSEAPLAPTQTSCCTIVTSKGPSRPTSKVVSQRCP